MKEIQVAYVDQKDGRARNDGKSWETAVQSVSHVTREDDRRIRFHVRNFELGSIVLPREDDEVHYHDDRYVDGHRGDDESDGLSWDTALRTAEGFDRAIGETPDGIHRRVVAHVKNIDGFDPTCHQQVQDDAMRSLQAGDHPRRTCHMWIQGYSRDAGFPEPPEVAEEGFTPVASDEDEKRAIKEEIQQIDRELGSELAENEHLPHGIDSFLDSCSVEELRQLLQQGRDELARHRLRDQDTEKPDPEPA